MSEHRLSCALCQRVEPKTGPFLRLVRLGNGIYVCEDCRVQYAQHDLPESAARVLREHLWELYDARD